mmetsp:Transcript_7979/g.23994  ORF Transcript_7979/g.23994 Transcript_7979/m.23994 type:complete len:96 (-) Transcript_7979:7-294(-)
MITSQDLRSAATSSHNLFEAVGVFQSVECIGSQRESAMTCDFLTSCTVAICVWPQVKYAPYDPMARSPHSFVMQLDQYGYEARTALLAQARLYTI